MKSSRGQTRQWMYYKTRINGKKIPKTKTERAMYSQDRYMAPAWVWSGPDKDEQVSFPQSIHELVGCHLLIEESCNYEHHGVIKAIHFYNQRYAKIPFLTCAYVVGDQCGTMRGRLFYPAEDQALYDGGWRHFVFTQNNLPTQFPENGKSDRAVRLSARH